MRCDFRSSAEQCLNVQMYWTNCHIVRLQLPSVYIIQLVCCQLANFSVESRSPALFSFDLYCHCDLDLDPDPMTLIRHRHIKQGLLIHGLWHDDIEFLLFYMYHWTRGLMRCYKMAVFTVRAYARAVLGVVILSVRLSVRPSVTRVDCDKTKWRTADIFIPHERAVTLLLGYQEWLVGDAPVPLKSAFKVTQPLRKTSTSTDFRS